MQKKTAGPVHSVFAFVNRTPAVLRREPIIRQVLAFYLLAPDVLSDASQNSH